jgi:hypothetical protein
MVFKRRNRLISFRLSEEEYESLRSLCVTEGARSVSDYARSTLCQVMTGGNGIDRSIITTEPQGEPTTQSLIASMERLSEVIARLSQLIERGASQQNTAKVFQNIQS